MKLLRRDPALGYLDGSLWIPKAEINLEGTKAALTFTLSTSRNLRILPLYKETTDHLLVPREFWDPAQLPFPVIDCRPTSYTTTKVKSLITLDVKTPGKTTQRDAVAALQAGRGGVLQLACGLGKTVCALELIAREKVPALIIVDNTQLLEQWKGEINLHLELDEPIGIIGDGQFDWERPVVLATYQSLAKKIQDGTLTKDIAAWFGLVIGDEAHHFAAPTWAIIADFFPGKRYGLTATPDRIDGSHVIYNFHLGPILYKDLIQELTPSVFFYWTGLEIDTADPRVRKLTCDVNGEIHNSMLSSYFGQWQDRLAIILRELKTAEKLGRKVLVLSYSIDELVNLFCLWSGQSLYTGVPYPASQEVGETAPPEQLDPRTFKKVIEKLNVIKVLEGRHRNDQKVMYGIKIQKDELNRLLLGHTVWQKCEKEYVRRQLAFLRKSLAANKSNAGLMIGDIKATDRMSMLKSKQIVFASMKYGREGLDEPNIDTVFICEPVSQKNILQQIMGRTLRKKTGKRTPVVMFFEDNIGPMMGMCQALRRHLREWPLEEGGPFTYDLVQHPKKGMMTTWATT